MWELDHKESWAPKNWCFWTVVLEKTLESSLNCKEIKPVNPKGNQSWIFTGRTDDKAETPNTLATWCKELTHWKRPWCWERLEAGGERDNRGWDGWMASRTRWTWVWARSRSWWWTGKPGMLQSMGLQRVRHNWATELNWLWNSIVHFHSFPPSSLPPTATSPVILIRERKFRKPNTGTKPMRTVTTWRSYTGSQDILRKHNSDDSEPDIHS